MRTTNIARRTVVVAALLSVLCCNNLHAEDERSSVGPASPAAEYCVGLGYESSVIQGDGGESGQCRFLDGSTCDDWTFYRGQCGQANSYCEKHGGTISSMTEDMGGWTGIYAECTMPGGAKCKEETFWTTGSCP